MFMLGCHVRSLTCLSVLHLGLDRTGSAAHEIT